MTPVPESARNLNGQLGPGWLCEFGPALNLLPLLGVHATETEGGEGVMAPEKHPGRGRERRRAGESLSQCHVLLPSPPALPKSDALLSKKPPN